MNPFLSPFAAAAVAGALVASSAAAAGDAVAGCSVDYPVDDAFFARQGKAARNEAFVRKETFTLKDLAAAMNRREPLGLKPLPPGSAALDDATWHRRVARATLALSATSERDHQAGRSARLGAAFLAQRGVAVTCFHALKGLDEPFAVVGLTAEGLPVKVVRILAVYPLEDLAFLQVEGAGDAALPLRPDAPVGLGVRALGHPLGKYFFNVAGTIGRYGLKEGAARQTRLHLMIPSVGGFSGSAVTDAAGNALGMLDSFETVRAEESSYEVHSAIPAAAILAHFARPYDAAMPPEAVAAALRPDPAAGAAVEIHTIRSEGQEGAVAAEVRSDDPLGFTVRAEDKAGRELAAGRPSATLRAGLPAWARELYDETVRAAEAKAAGLRGGGSGVPAALAREVVTHRVEAKNDAFAVVTEVRSSAPGDLSVTVKDAAGKDIARGAAAPAFRESLPAAARPVYDASVSAARQKIGR